AVELLFVVLGEAAIDPVLAVLGREVGLAGLERVLEDAHDLVGVGPLPETMHDLVEIAAYDAAFDLAEDGPRDRVDSADAQGRVDEIDAQRGLIEQALELLAAIAQSLLRLAAQAGQLDLRVDARPQLARAERLDEVVVGPGGCPFDARLFAGAGREHDDRQRAGAVIVA